MSKQRPSQGAAAAGLPPRSPPQDKTAQPWLQRVFHNTYTRRGRRVALSGWSVKIQAGGQRRTFSLVAKTRAGAAAEARAIYDNISSAGWEAVVRRYSGQPGLAFRRTDVRYWKERLLLRNHPAPAGEGAPLEFSTRIEHAGTGHYFPLGSSEPEAAAVRALEIYCKVIERGWDAAMRAFPREVTLAFHWAYDPLLWTYTTLHTLDGKMQQRLGGRGDEAVDARRVLVVEGNAGIRDALAQCISQQGGYRGVACPTASAARRQVAGGGVALCLVNRDLAGGLGVLNPAQVSTLPAGIATLCYSVHADSEELFALTPGGATGYVLKRTAPHHILEPVQGAAPGGEFSPETLLAGAHSYFQRLLQSGPTGKVSSMVEQLTRREQDVLSLMSKGYLDKEIATALGISNWTVHEHVKRIFEKLKVHSRTEAVLACLQK